MLMAPRRAPERALGKVYAMRLSLAPLLLILAPLALACSGSPSSDIGAAAANDAAAPAPSSDDAGPDDSSEPGEDAAADASTSPQGDAGGACSDLAQLGDDVPVERIAEPLPTNFAGGALEGGTYVATKMDIYTGEGGASGITTQIRMGKLTARLRGTAWETRQDKGTSPPKWQTQSLTANGAELRVTRTCPADGETSDVRYDVDTSGGATRVRVLQAGAGLGLGIVMTYTRK